MKMKTITEPKIVKIKVSDLKFDKDNPNEMTESQMQGLRKSMEEFGYLAPIVVDQNNMIADGEHRVWVYKEFKKTEIPAFKLKFANDSRRKMYRQVANKLRGEHNLQRDVEELKAIAKYDNNLDILSTLIAQDKVSLQYLIREQDEATANYAKDSKTKHDDNDYESQEEKDLGELKTFNKCPKCGFEY